VHFTPTQSAILAALTVAAATLTTQQRAHAQTPPTRPAAPQATVTASATPVNSAALRPCAAVTVDPPMTLTLGKSRVVRLDFPVARMVVGGQAASRAGRRGW